MSASRRRSSWIAALAALALAWHALLPLATAAVAPRTHTTLCTALGVRVVALDEDQAPVTHGAGDHCPLCRIAAGGDAPLPVSVWKIDRTELQAPALALPAANAMVRSGWTPGSPRAPPPAWSALAADSPDVREARRRKGGGPAAGPEGRPSEAERRSASR